MTSDFHIEIRHMSNLVICVCRRSFCEDRSQFLCKRSVMRLIRCHTWTPAYHTPSCSTDTFNLRLSCFTISGSSFPFPATPPRNRLKVNLVNLLYCLCTAAHESFSSCFISFPFLPSVAVEVHTKNIYTKRGKQTLPDIYYPSSHTKASAASQLPGKQAESDVQ